MRLIVHQRQEAVRRPAGDQFQFARLEKAPEAVEQVVAVLVDEHVAGPLEALLVHARERIELRLPARALDFLAGQGHQVVDVPDVAVLQERVAQHGGQRRRDRHGHPPVDAVALQTVEDFQKRDVCFGDRLVEPVFFEEIVIFRMTDERQMGVQYQAEVTKRHWRNRSRALGVQQPSTGQPEAVIRGLSYKLQVPSSRLPARRRAQARSRSCRIRLIYFLAANVQLVHGRGRGED